MAIRQVGSGKTYSTITAAYNAAVNGDTIEVDIGTYGDPNLVVVKSLTFSRNPLQTGFVIINSQGNWLANGKGYFVTGNAGAPVSGLSITFNDFQFVGATNGPGGNAAGIRYENGSLTLNRCWFHDNQNGILCAADPVGQIIIDKCEFGFNGSGSGLTHNFYGNSLALIRVTNSYFHDVAKGTVVEDIQGGNTFKSRAVQTDVSNCRIYGSNQSNWEVDFPDGGICNVTNCVIQQSVTASPINPGMTSMRVENLTPTIHTTNRVTYTGCTFINDNSTGTLLVNGQGDPYTYTSCNIWKIGSLTLPAGASFTLLSTRPTLDTSQPWTSGGPTIISGAGSSVGVSSTSAISVIVPPASTAFYRSDAQVAPSQTSSVTAYRSDDEVPPIASSGITALRSFTTITPLQTRVNSVFDKPSGVVAGDTLIIIQSLGNPTGLPTVTGPAGFTALTTLPAGTLSLGVDPYRTALYGWFKVAGSSEPTTYTVTHASSDVEGVMYAISGGSTTVAPNVSVTTGAGVSVIAGSITMANANGFVIEAVACWDDARGTPPTNFTERYDPASVHVFYAADETVTGSGATGTATSTHSGNSAGPWAAMLIGVEPAPAAGSTRVNTVFNKPAGVVVGDTLVLMMSAFAQTALPTFTPPAGFTAIGTIPANTHTDSGGLVGGQYAWYRVIDGSEAATFTVTHTAAKTEGELLAISGGNGLAPTRILTSGTGTTSTGGAMTFANANGHLIHFVYTWGDVTGSPPTSFTERYDVAGVHNLYVASRVFPSSGTTGSISSSHANNTGADTFTGTMMIAIESIATGVSLRTNTVFNKPAGVAAGDTIIALLYVSAQTTLPTVTPPSGFLNIGASNPVTTFTDGTNLASGVFAWYKIAGGSEPATYQFTHSAANTEGDMYAVGGGDGQVPKIITNSGTGTTVTTGSLNLTNPNAFLIEAVYAHDDATGTPPANFTERYDP